MARKRQISVKEAKEEQRVSARNALIYVEKGECRNAVVAYMNAAGWQFARGITTPELLKARSAVMSSCVRPTKY